jgi:hypothetical protein
MERRKVGREEENEEKILVSQILWHFPIENSLQKKKKREKENKIAEIEEKQTRSKNEKKTKKNKKKEIEKKIESERKKKKRVKNFEEEPSPFCCTNVQKRK